MDLDLENTFKVLKKKKGFKSFVHFWVENRNQTHLTTLFSVSMDDTADNI